MYKAAEFSVISVSRELFRYNIIIRLVVTGKRVVKIWYVKSGGGLATHKCLQCPNTCIFGVNTVMIESY